MSAGEPVTAGRSPGEPVTAGRSAREPVTAGRSAREPVTAGRTAVTDYTMFYEQVDGVPVRRMEPIEVAWRRFGSGPPLVVCLHSVNRASSLFDAVASALERDAGVITLDLRGFGASHRPAAGASIAELAADVLRVVAECADAPPVYYGHGLGACVAVVAACEAASPAVALSGVAFAAGEPDGLAALELAGQDGRPSLDLPSVLGEAATEDLAPLVVGHVVRAWRSFDAAELIRRVPPVLALAGSHDGLTPAEVPGGAAWAARQSGGRLVRLAGGHDLPSEQPEEVAAALGDWLNELTPREEDRDGRA